MLSAICFSCGAQKNGPFDVCGKCGSVPTSASHRTVSLALSQHISSEAQLVQYESEIRGGVKASIPMGALSKAIAGVKAGLGVTQGTPSTPNGSVKDDSTLPSQSHKGEATDTPRSGEDTAWEPFGTSIDNVPFAVLGATPRDTRARIVELAEERSLELDPAACHKARSDLTTPRTRLSAEIAWFPGLSPGKIAKCLGVLRTDPMSVRHLTGLPPLAHFNLMTYALEGARNQSDSEAMADFLGATARRSEDVNAESVLRDVNEDRDIAKFPPAQSAEQVKSALGEHRITSRTIIKLALNRLPSQTLVNVLTKAVEGATGSGETPAPQLLDDLVDSYRDEVNAVLETGAARIRELLRAIQSLAESNASAIDAKISQLEGAVRKWDAIAQPIQLSAKARGTNHALSDGLANEMRSLAVELFNDHDLLMQAQRITKLLGEVFAELPEVVERVEKDADDLDEIARSRRDAAPFQALRTRCSEAASNANTNPGAAHMEGERLLQDGIGLLNATLVDASSPALADAKDILAGTLMQCAIEYGNKTSRWAPCMALLERALELATDTKLRYRIAENLATTRSNLNRLEGCEPISKAPSLSTVNGIGFTLYGNSDPRPDGSHMATYYFVFFGIPIFPIARYRVIPINGGYRFLGKRKLRTFDKWHLSLSFALIGLAILSGLAS